MNGLHSAPAELVKAVEIVGVACAHGAGISGSESAPDTVQAGGLVARLQERGRPVTWRETIHAAPAGSGAAVHAVADVCERLAQRVQAITEHGGLPVVIGGDHTCAIGTWKGVAGALRTRGPLGLIWIDAHMDAHTPQTTASGALHGMPLACLLGHGDPHLTALGGGISLGPRYLCLIGVRSYENEEAALLRQLGVRVFYMDEVARRGLATVMREALAIVTAGSAGFGLSIDLDVLDPRDAPGVNTPVENGVRSRELATALACVSAHPALAAIEFAEFNPLRDRGGRTASSLEKLLDAVVFGTGQSSSGAALIEMEHYYGAHHYDPLPVVLTRGEGVYLWDNRGRRYLDMMGAYSAVSHGHCHPRLVEAMTAQAQRLAVTSRVYHNDRLPLFLKRLCEISGQDMAMPVNTGLEAVEAALKAARKWGHKVKCIPEDRAEIIACDGNFHGRSITILAMSSEPQYRDGFGPYPPGFKRIPFGDAQALEQAISPQTAAFLVEPIQGEGGIILPPRGYLAACAEICRRHNVLLICDEVQTGLGRTGRLFASEHDGVRPDGLILGKALGGGLLPVSAFLGRRDVMEVFTPGDHGSTFGGSPLAAAVGLAAIEIMLDDGFAQRATVLGEYLVGGLRELKSPLIREVRGMGLLIGVEFDPALVAARSVCDELMQHGVLSKDAHETVVRFAPPLIVTREQLDGALVALRRALAQLEAGIKRDA